MQSGELSILKYKSSNYYYKSIQLSPQDKAVVGLQEKACDLRSVAFVISQIQNLIFVVMSDGSVGWFFKSCLKKLHE